MQTDGASASPVIQDLDGDQPMEPAAGSSGAAQNKEEELPAHLQEQEESSGNEEHQQEDETLNSQTVQSQCLLSFKVQNSSILTKTIELFIRPKSAANGDAMPCNFRLPLSEVPCEVFSNSSKYVIHLTKLDPFIDDWGEFEWSFRVLQKQPVNPYASSNWQNNNVGPTAESGDNYDFEDQPDAYTAGGAASGEKACPACTFLNPAYSLQCEVCQTNI